MSVAASGALVRIPTGERPAYGSPYPEGIAAGFVSLTGDASGGAFSMSLLADPGFLFRLELLQMTRGSSTIRDAHVITDHSWIEDASGHGNGSFSLDWALEGLATGFFAAYQLNSGALGVGSSPLAEIRRVPMGSLAGAPGVAQQIMFLSVSNNDDTITHEWRVVCTYWKKESLYLPGFLSSFLESPSTPPVVRGARG